MKKILAILLSVSAILCLLAGCGTNTDDKTEEKIWIIATDTAFRPFEYKDAQGNLVGVDVDILAAIAEDQGFKYEIKSSGWSASVAACQSGQADAILAGVSVTEERKAEGWIFSDGYYNCTQVMTVAENSDIKGFEDLRGKQVAVKAGTTGADYANSLKDQYGFTIASFEDSTTMYQAVIEGQTVACFEDTPVMKASIKESGLGLRVLEDTQNEGSDYGLAIFNEENRELLDMFNAGLKNIKENGKYDEIINKYFNE